MSADLTAKPGEWVVTHLGVVVAKGETMQDAIDAAAEIGWEDEFLVQMVVEGNLCIGGMHFNRGDLARVAAAVEARRD